MLLLKVKIMHLRGAFFGGAGHFCDQIFFAPGAEPWHFATEHRTLRENPLCGSALTDTIDNLDEMSPLKFTDFCLFLYHQLYTTLQEPLIPPIWL